MSTEEIRALMKDLKLCTDTAAALSSKLIKLQGHITNLFEQLQLIEEAGTPTSQAPAAQPAAARPRAAPPTRQTSPQAVATSGTAYQADVSDQGVSSELDDFVSFLKGTDEPKKISKRLSELRDRLMEVSTSHNPAFFEMGSWAGRIGRQSSKLDGKEKEELMNKAYDWRVRLTQS
ncbi:MAG: hypothetical protein ACXACI_09955 [Candidatus Hodarchaeales archaeon]